MDSTEIMNSTELLDIANQQATEKISVLQKYFNNFMPNFLSFLMEVIIAILVLLIGGKLIKWILKIIKNSLNRHDMDQSVSSFLLSLIKYALYFVLVMIILNVFGIATASVVAVLGSAGLTAGLALQGSLQNFAGGVLILMLKPFKAGDYIVVNGSNLEGSVSEITIYYTKLLTIDNKVIMIPNGSLTTNSITNVSMMDKRRLDLAVGVAYDSDLEKVKAILAKLVKEEPCLLEDEPVQIFVSELGDSSITMGVRIWVQKDNYWETKWRMTENIKKAFDQNGISIPFPQLDVQIKQ